MTFLDPLLKPITEFKKKQREEREVKRLAKEAAFEAHKKYLAHKTYSDELKSRKEGGVLGKLMKKISNGVSVAIKEQKKNKSKDEEPQITLGTESLMSNFNIDDRPEVR